MLILKSIINCKVTLKIHALEKNVFTNYALFESKRKQNTNKNIKYLS